jgi:hypothetical protein
MGRTFFHQGCLGLLASTRTVILGSSPMMTNPSSSSSYNRAFLAHSPNNNSLAFLA